MKFTLTIPDGLPAMTVKELLEEQFLIPRKIRHFLRTKKHVSVNGLAINWQTVVKPGDDICLIFDEEDYPQKTILIGNGKLVEELYQDQHLIIVNKPEGMKTHANEPRELALLNHVSAYVGETCYVVHRLDKETSGAILFAKNPFVLPILNRLLEKREISREYWALVQGKFPSKKLIYKDKTGRTHQIRVHLAHHGHPLIGDPLYHPQPKGRLMLHAHRLTFTHPFTLEKITVEARSDNFEKVLSSLNAR